MQAQHVGFFLRAGIAHVERNLGQIDEVRRIVRVVAALREPVSRPVPRNLLDEATDKIPVLAVAPAIGTPLCFHW